MPGTPLTNRLYRDPSVTFSRTNPWQAPYSVWSIDTNYTRPIPPWHHVPVHKCDRAARSW